MGTSDTVTGVLGKVREIVAHKLRIPLERVTPELVIEDYCTDSIMFIDLLGALQHHFGRANEAMWDGAIVIETVADLVECAERAQEKYA